MFHGTRRVGRVTDAAVPEELMEGYWAAVGELAAESGQATAPGVAFNERGSRGVAAYHPIGDRVVLHPAFVKQLGAAYAGGARQMFRGVVLHELGHRSDKFLIFARQGVALAVSAVGVIGAVVVASSPALQRNWAVPALLWAVVLLGLFAVFALSWYAELRADDAALDVGGPAAATAMLDLLDRADAKPSLLHPPTRMRRRRQVRRSSGKVPARSSGRRP